MTLRLTGGPYSLDLAPEIGGAVSRCWFEGSGQRVEILRPGPADLTDPTQAGCFPMAPFCNRLRNGRIYFKGKNLILARNRDHEAHPLHGTTWLTPWRIQNVQQGWAELGVLHEAGPWPWRFSASQTFNVSNAGLEIGLSVHNLDQSAMPIGLGLHPYFPSTDNTKIRTQVSSVMQTDNRSLATGTLSPAEGEFDLTDRSIASSGLDHGFTNWSGSLDIDYGTHSLRMTASSNAKWLQVYAPPGQGYFCAEPVTQANDAFASPESAWASLGIKVLEPGETETLVMVLQCKVG